MVERLFKPRKSQSFFLFGARGTGKSTLVKKYFNDEKTLWINLLDEEVEDLYRSASQTLSQQLATKKYDWVVIDEVQKLPGLLDRVHMEIENKSAKFVLTGSSARKLKAGGANLLAGRAFSYDLFPLSIFELKNLFELNHALKFGTLPRLLEFTEEQDKKDFLSSYVKTYLKEEILLEQIIRKVDPFRHFLEVAAQMNGAILNYKKIGDDIGVDDKTVHSYFQILEDTLLGFSLPAFHLSVRKRQRVAPKFYFFDTGVKRALEKKLNQELTPGTYDYGKAFEHRVILEVFWLNSYFQTDYSFSYLRTKDDAEIDLIIQRPNGKTLLIEIKSSTKITESNVKNLKPLLQDWTEPAEAAIWSLDSEEKNINGIKAVFWIDGLRELFSKHLLSK